jgi:hypothetical protein
LFSIILSSIVFYHPLNTSEVTIKTIQNGTPSDPFMCYCCLTLYDLKGSDSQALSKMLLVVALAPTADAEKVICLCGLRLPAPRMQGMPAIEEVPLLYSHKAVHVDMRKYGGSGGSHKS